MYPFVSVVMPVYNYSEYLEDAIVSILFQTYENFEFIIVNDGSTETEVEEIILRYCDFDDRIVYLKNEKNMGIPYTLNKAIDVSRGDLIARMDADDISELNRLEIQVDFLNNNPHVDILGATVKVFSKLPDPKKKHVMSYFQDYEYNRTFLMFGVPMIHPTLVVRRHVFEKVRYDEDFPNIEDYKLYVDCCDQFFMTNLPRVVLNYRVHSQSNMNRDKQRKQGMKVRHLMLSRIGADLTDDDIYYFQKKTIFGKPIKEVDAKTKNVAFELVKTNRKTKYVCPSVFETFLLRKSILTSSELEAI